MASEHNLPGQEIQDCVSLVPEQKSGWEITAKASFAADSNMAARDFFKVVSQRLLNVNDWELLLKGKLGKFHLTDSFGSPVRGAAQKGHFIRIDVTGPGPKSGGGYDWVRIEDIQRCENESETCLAMRVRPCNNPSGRKSIVSHFYAPGATSTFTVLRKQTTVTAAIYDRNISVNRDGVSFWEKIRNVVAGIFGKLAVSKIQWQDLADGLIAR